MNETRLNTVAQLRAFLDGTLEVQFQPFGEDAQRHAAVVNAFCQQYLNPYVNFHRPYFFAESFTDSKGKTRKRYPFEKMMTPYEKLKH